MIVVLVQDFLDFYEVVLTWLDLAHRHRVGRTRLDLEWLLAVTKRLLRWARSLKLDLEVDEGLTFQVF